MKKEFWREQYEWVLLAGALILMLASLAWWWAHRSVVTTISREPVAVRLSGAAYTPEKPPADEPRVANWPAPPAQSHGAEWRYEVFTPPVIYYHATTKSFVVTPPAMKPRAARPVALELVEVRPQPYRLQLTGYLGTPGDYVAVFSSPSGADTLLARAGQRIESQGVSLKRIDVAKVSFDDVDGRPAFDWMARAILTDERAGEDVVLDSQSRHLTGRLTAVFRRTADPVGSSFEAAEGDTLLQGNTACRVTRIQLEPPQVLLERAGDTGEAEQLILAPVAGHAKGADLSRGSGLPLGADGTKHVVTADKER